MYPDKHTNEAFMWCFGILIAVFWIIEIVAGIISLPIYFFVLHHNFWLIWTGAMLLVSWIIYLILSFISRDWDGWKLPLFFCLISLFVVAIIFIIVASIKVVLNSFDWCTINFFQMANWAAFIFLIIFFICPLLWPAFMIIAGLMIRSDER